MLLCYIFEILVEGGRVGGVRYLVMYDDTFKLKNTFGYNCI